ncbi:hypothetical protein [Microbacterium sp.]|uniref:hypothetical protein n=1 Tax=Microbacterium sp. TaxID=51671 RepID=UPI00391BEF16
MIEPAPARRSPDVLPDDDDTLVGFAPRCTACWGRLHPRHTDTRAWWECGECALPRIV